MTHALKPSDEREIATAAMAGDDEALGDLLALHQAAAYNVAYRLLGREADARDAVQEAFLIAVQAARGKSAAPRDKSSFGAWLTRVVVNASLGQLRRRAAVRTVSVDQAAHMLAGPEDVEPPRNLERAEVRGDVLRALIALPDAQRAVLTLREYQGLSYDDIGSLLGIGRNAVAQLLFRARASFRAAYEGLSATPGEVGCPELGPLISAMVDGELGATAWQELDTHLGQCSRCRRELEGLRRARRLYALIPALSAPAGWQATAGAGAAVGAGAAGLTAPALLSPTTSAIAGGGLVAKAVGAIGSKAVAAALGVGLGAATLVAPSAGLDSLNVIGARVGQVVSAATAYVGGSRSSETGPTEERWPSGRSEAGGGGPVGMPTVRPAGGDTTDGPDHGSAPTGQVVSALPTAPGPPTPSPAQAPVTPTPPAAPTATPPPTPPPTTVAVVASPIPPTATAIPPTATSIPPAATTPPEPTASGQAESPPATPIPPSDTPTRVPGPPAVAAPARPRIAATQPSLPAIPPTPPPVPAPATPALPVDEPPAVPESVPPLPTVEIAATPVPVVPHPTEIVPAVEVPPINAPAIGEATPPPAPAGLPVPTVSAPAPVGSTPVRLPTVQVRGPDHRPDPTPSERPAGPVAPPIPPQPPMPSAPRPAAPTVPPARTVAPPAVPTVSRPAAPVPTVQPARPTPRVAVPTVAPKLPPTPKPPLPAPTAKLPERAIPSAPKPTRPAGSLPIPR